MNSVGSHLASSELYLHCGELQNPKAGKNVSAMAIPFQNVCSCCKEQSVAFNGVEQVSNNRESDSIPSGGDDEVDAPMQSREENRLPLGKTLEER